MLTFEDGTVILFAHKEGMKAESVDFIGADVLFDF